MLRRTPEELARPLGRVDIRHRLLMNFVSYRYIYGGEGTSQVKPTESARFLGVWLDWKLSWRAHCKALGKKLKTQDFALSRIAAKTWGPSLAKVREVYSKCIRSAIAYGASSYHTLTPIGGKPTSPAKTLAKAQNRSLRIVAGAYKSTLTRCLETET